MALSGLLTASGTRRSAARAIAADRARILAAGGRSAAISAASIRRLLTRCGCQRVSTAISLGALPPSRSASLANVWRSSRMPWSDASSSQLTGAITASALTSAFTVSNPKFGGVSIDRGEVLAHDVLDQRGFERAGAIDDLVDQRGDRGLSGELGGAPASLARDELVAAGPARAHDHGLQHAALTDRRRQRSQRRVIEAFAGLVGIGMNLGDRELSQPVSVRTVASRSRVGVVTTAGCRADRIVDPQRAPSDGAHRTLTPVSSPASSR